MAATKSPFDTEIVRDLARLLAETDLTEIEVEKADLRIRVARQIHAAVTVAAPVAAAPQIAASAVHAVVPAEAKATDHPNAVRSPMVGTAYRRANPESKAFVEVGTIVKEGDKILLVEAMKTFNDIVAPRSGTVTHIFVEDKQPVEYGEALIVIE